jgi:hypothetical protein
MRKWGEPNACAFSSALPRCRRPSSPAPAPSLPHMQRSALGCGPPILPLGAQACVGGAARPSRIAPTPRWWPPVRLRMSRRLYPTSVGGAGSGLVRSPSRAAASKLLPRLLLCHADAPAPLGSRQRALCCRPPSERLVGPLTFVTAFGLRRVPYAEPGLCVSRAPPTHLRLSRGRACASRIARTCIARLPPSAVRPSAAQLL